MVQRDHPAMQKNRTSYVHRRAAAAIQKYADIRQSRVPTAVLLQACLWSKRKIWSVGNAKIVEPIRQECNLILMTDKKKICFELSFLFRTLFPQFRMNPRFCIFSLFEPNVLTCYPLRRTSCFYNLVPNFWFHSILTLCCFLLSEFNIKSSS